MGNLISKKVQMSLLYKRSNAIINNHHKKDDNGGYGKLFHSVIKENKSILSEDLVHLDHHIIRELWKSNFSSPVGDLLKDSNAKILDVGCGLGAWLCEISTSYPKSEFIGVDALPIFPTIKPYNVKFIQRNVLDGLPFENNTFDFVHIRGLVYDFTESQWINDVYKELLRVLKPGGWLEICEAETKAYNAGPLSDILYTAIYKDATSENVNPLICEAHKSNLHAVLRNNNYDTDEEIVIHHEKKLCPIGRWSGKVGETAALYIVGSLKNYFINIKEKNVLKLYKSYINANSSDASSIGSGSHRSCNKKELKVSDELIEILLDEYDVYKTYYFYHRFYYQKKL